MTNINKEEAKQTIKDKVSSCKKWCKENKTFLIYTGAVFGTGFIFGSKSCRPVINRLNNTIYQLSQQVSTLSKRPPIQYMGTHGDGGKSLVLFDSDIPSMCFTLRHDFTEEEFNAFYDELKNMSHEIKIFK